MARIPTIDVLIRIARMLSKPRNCGDTIEATITTATRSSGNAHVETKCKVRCLGIDEVVVFAVAVDKLVVGVLGISALLMLHDLADKIRFGPLVPRTDVRLLSFEIGRDGIAKAEYLIRVRGADDDSNPRVAEGS